MPADEIRLIASVAGAIIVVIVLVVRFQVHAFLALTIAALLLGFATAVPALDALLAFKAGFGDIAGNIGILLVLGAMLGRILADSGATGSIVRALLHICPPRRAGWALCAAAFVVGLPLFFESALVLLMPTIAAVALMMPALNTAVGEARDVDRLLLVGIPALAALATLHGLVPPHPGPLIAVEALHADLGRTLAYGVLLAVPIVILAGPCFASIAARLATAKTAVLTPSSAARPPPSAGPLALLLLSAMTPILLILLKTLGPLLLPDGRHQALLEYLGTPAIAMLAGLLLAMATQLLLVRQNRHELSMSLADSCGSVASILLIICAGGGFKAVLIKSGVGTVVAHAAAQFSLSLLVLGWLVAVVIRLATGSATVATITASAILAPMFSLNPVNPALLALSIGAGSLFLSHVNDAGFWLVKECFGMSVLDTFKTWSLMLCLISLLGLGGVLLVDALGW